MIEKMKLLTKKMKRFLIVTTLGILMFLLLFNWVLVNEDITGIFVVFGLAIFYSLFGGTYVVTGNFSNIIEKLKEDWEE